MSELERVTVLLQLSAIALKRFSSEGIESAGEGMSSLFQSGIMQIKQTAELAMKLGREPIPLSSNPKKLGRRVSTANKVKK